MLVKDRIDQAPWLAIPRLATTIDLPDDDGTLDQSGAAYRLGRVGREHHRQFPAARN